MYANVDNTTFFGLGAVDETIIIPKNSDLEINAGSLVSTASKTGKLTNAAWGATTEEVVLIKSTKKLASVVRLKLDASTTIVSIIGGSHSVIPKGTVIVVAKGSVVGSSLVMVDTLDTTDSEVNNNVGGEAEATTKKQAVTKLQTHLAAAGYDPGDIDGAYGSNTNSAAIEAASDGKSMSDLGLTTGEAALVAQAKSAWSAGRSSGSSGGGGGGGGGTTPTYNQNQFAPYEQQSAGLGTVGWLLIGLGVVGGGYYGYQWYTKNKASKKPTHGLFGRRSHYGYRW